jgi:TPR repeat protein
MRIMTFQEYAMRMRYANILPSIILVLMFFGHNARAQKPTPVTDRAFQELKEKAEKGDPKAQYALGFKCNQNEDYAEAVKWYRRAAEQGYAMAQFNLGIMYEFGVGVLQDYAEAVKWYRRAAEQGHAMAQCNLGIMYDSGQGVPQDYAEAAKWYRRAAEQGHAKAQFNLTLVQISFSRSNILARV